MKRKILIFAVALHAAAFASDLPGNENGMQLRDLRDLSFIHRVHIDTKWVVEVRHDTNNSGLQIAQCDGSYTAEDGSQRQVKLVTLYRDFQGRSPFFQPTVGATYLVLGQHGANAELSFPSFASQVAWPRHVTRLQAKSADETSCYAIFASPSNTRLLRDPDPAHKVLLWLADDLASGSNEDRERSIRFLSRLTSVAVEPEVIADVLWLRNEYSTHLNKGSKTLPVEFQLRLTALECSWKCPGAIEDLQKLLISAKNSALLADDDFRVTLENLDLTGVDPYTSEARRAAVARNSGWLELAESETSLFLKKFALSHVWINEEAKTRLVRLLDSPDREIRLHILDRLYHYKQDSNLNPGANPTPEREHQIIDVWKRSIPPS